MHGAAASEYGKARIFSSHKSIYDLHSLAHLPLPTPPSLFFFSFVNEQASERERETMKMKIVIEIKYERECLSKIVMRL